ncbi:site-specific integrase [Colwellia sp. 75C3]|uniref:site-specific integrase n=1 Tax=Colwellia sp. 75C3 TaxID=888425 RepID=UPI0012FF347D|nr:site-specific integrase [Colwellia sp. 75C3]
MEKFIHNNNYMSHIQVERFVSFVDSDGTPLLFPTFFSISMNKLGIISLAKKVVDEDTNEVEHQLVDSEIGEATINQYEDEILHFLQYLEHQSFLAPDLPNVHMHTHAPSELINEYINDYLIEESQKGIKVVDKARVTLSAYYNYLAAAGVTNVRKIYIYPKLRKVATKNVKRKRTYQYVQKSTRTIMNLECRTQRDELLLRFGYECGLRSIENTGLFLRDFTYGRKPQKGFLSLFDELKKDLDKNSFEYLLTITKRRSNQGSPSRTIYIPRALLENCHEYYLTERPESDSNSLFANYGASTSGSTISQSTATRIFREVRERLLEGDAASEIFLNNENSYHHLRHSFATEKFYELCGEIPHHSINEGHAVITEMARLMGHKINKKTHAQVITMRYIRSVDFMLDVES